MEKSTLIVISGIPFPSGSLSDTKQYYAKISTYLLKDIIAKDRKIDRVFHLNFTNDFVLVKYLKKLFKCKIILVSHYTNWSFSLNGDVGKLKRLLNKCWIYITIYNQMNAL